MELFRKSSERLFSQESFIVDVWMSSKYASVFPALHNLYLKYLWKLWMMLRGHHGFQNGDIFTDRIFIQSNYATYIYIFYFDLEPVLKAARIDIG